MGSLGSKPGRPVDSNQWVAVSMAEQHPAVHSHGTCETTSFIGKNTETTSFIGTHYQFYREKIHGNYQLITIAIGKSHQ